MITPLAPTLFTRRYHSLQALTLESQVWFSVKDLGRLMGKPVEEQHLGKLDPDQTRFVWLLRHREARNTLMVSESGMYALLIYHGIPEKLGLRRWLSNDVIPSLHGARRGSATNLWSMRLLRTLLWQHEPWVKWRDTPGVEERRLMSWWEKVMRFFRAP